MSGPENEMFASSISTRDFNTLVKTPDEKESKRQKAVEFLRRIGNDDAADEFDDMSAEEYAEHKGAVLIEENPTIRRAVTMACRKSKAQLQAELDEAQSYINDLERKLDDIK